MIGVDARMFCRPINTAFGQVTVRPIVPGDADMMQVFVGNLSGPARYFRFFQPLMLLPQNLLKRLTRPPTYEQVQRPTAPRAPVRPQISNPTATFSGAPRI